MLDSISTRFTNDDADETTSESETRSRRRFLRRTATGVGAITTVGAGTGTAAATRRYEVRRLRTRTPGQPAIEDVELVHDRRLFGEDVVFHRGVAHQLRSAVRSAVGHGLEGRELGVGRIGDGSVGG
jgi:hypothetical protein